MEAPQRALTIPRKSSEDMENTLAPGSIMDLCEMLWHFKKIRSLPGIAWVWQRGLKALVLTLLT